jgi:hypothetical protein
VGGGVGVMSAHAVFLQLNEEEDRTMIPMKITENHYINPEAIDQVLIRPKTDERPAALCIVFSDDNQIPLEVYGEEAEEAIVNWRNFHQQQAA